jgi:hypothetical protein
VGGQPSAGVSAGGQHRSPAGQVPAILANPRYTSRQMRNRQRKTTCKSSGSGYRTGSIPVLKRAAAARLSGASMGRDKIASVVQVFADLITVARAAAPADKARIYTGLGPRLACQPGGQLVRDRSPRQPC